MKPPSKSVITATASSAAVDTTSFSVGDCETISRKYQAKALGITIFGVVGFVVFIKYVVTKYFAELEAIQQHHSEF